MKKWTTLHITMCSLLIALTAIGANITAIAPFLVVGGVQLLCKPFSLLWLVSYLVVV